MRTQGTFVLLLTLAVAGASCGRPEAGKPLRFLDRLERKNVVASPLRTLDNEFAILRETVEASDLMPVVTDSRTSWAFATTARVLKQADEQFPRSVTLQQQGREWRFSRVPLDSFATWRLIEGEKGINLSRAIPGEKRKGQAKLGPGAGYEVSILLPPGPAVFELEGLSGEPEKYRAEVEVTVNGKVHSLEMGSGPRYQFADHARFGNNMVKLAFVRAHRLTPKQQGESEEHVLLRSLKAHVAADLVLLDLPGGGTRPEGHLTFQYVPQPSDVIVPVGKSLAGESFRHEIRMPASGTSTLELSGTARGAGLLQVLRTSQGKSEFDVRNVDGAGSGSWTYSFYGPKDAPVVLDVSFEPALGQRTGEEGDFLLDALVVRDPRRTLEMPLYLLKDRTLDDAGMGRNPWAIKKKVRVKGTAYNALMSSPPSELRFRTRVPENALLDLGYSMMGEAWEAEGDGVGFEVLLERGEKTRSVFFAWLDPSHKPGDREIFSRVLDLSAYQGQTLDIVFKTYASLQDRPEPSLKSDRRHDLAVWINPVLRQNPRPDAQARTAVVLISLDAVRADHVGCYGYDRETTPAVDGLARDGALFLNAYSQAPYTLASHISILTGTYPTRHNVFYFSDSLDRSVLTLADALRTGGFATAGFTGGGLLDGRYGFSKGFDEYHDHIIAQEVPDTVGPLYRQASSWIERHKDEDFFLFLHTYQAHSPYRTPPPYGTMFLDKDAAWTGRSVEQLIGAGYVHKYRPLSEAVRRNIIGLYDGEIRYTDEFLIRPLVQDLKRLGLYDRALIIVLADHGEEFFDHVSWGHSNTVYDELLRVPLIIKFPAGRFRGDRVATNVRLVDLLPTVCEALDVRVPKAIDGLSLLSVLENEDTEDRLVLSYLPEHIFADPAPSKFALIQGRYKLILNQDYPDRAYIYYSPPPPPLSAVELYDLARDPGERRNLANLQRDVVQRMTVLANSHLQGTKKGGYGKKVLMDKELEERLRALGYIK